MNGNTVTKVIFESTVLYTICLHKNSKMKTTKLYQIKIFIIYFLRMCKKLIIKVKIKLYYFVNIIMIKFRIYALIVFIKNLISNIIIVGDSIYVNIYLC